MSGAKLYQNEEMTLDSNLNPQETKRNRSGK